MKNGFLGGGYLSSARFGIGFALVALGACARPSGNEPATPTAAGEAAPAAPPSDAPALEPAPAPPPVAQGLDRARPRDDDGREEFVDVADAERALDRAKADLDRLALAEPPRAAGRVAPRSSAGSANADKKSEKSAESRDESVESARAREACENACRAFASLARAASAVCRLDGEHGRHCERAERVRSTAQARVASCACPTSQ